MESKYKGMTVNERLYISGLIDDFEKAVAQKDRKKVVSILQDVEIKDQVSINVILQSLHLI